MGIAALELGKVIVNFFRKSLKSEYLKIYVSGGDFGAWTVGETSS